MILGIIYLDPLQAFVALLESGGQEGPIHVAQMTPVSLSSPTVIFNGNLCPKYVKIMVFLHFIFLKMKESHLVRRIRLLGHE